MRQESCKPPRRVGALSGTPAIGVDFLRAVIGILPKFRIFNAAESAFGGQAIRKSIHIGFANAFCDSQRAQQGPCDVGCSCKTGWRPVLALG
jgi:hypothetical protein